MRFSSVLSSPWIIGGLIIPSMVISQRRPAFGFSVTPILYGHELRYEPSDISDNEKIKHEFGSLVHQGTSTYWANTSSMRDEHTKNPGCLVYGQEGQDFLGAGTIKASIHFAIIGLSRLNDTTAPAFTASITTTSDGGAVLDQKHYWRTFQQKSKYDVPLGNFAVSYDVNLEAHPTSDKLGIQVSVCGLNNNVYLFIENITMDFQAI